MNDELRHDDAEELEAETASDQDVAETPDTAGEDPDHQAGDDEATGLEAEIQRLETELSGERDRLLRTIAEMENLRKRTRREVADSRRFAQADLLRPLLEILDNFDRALQHGPGDDEEGFRKGVELIAQSFRQALLDGGVRPIEAAGHEFDPTRHEAVGQAPATDEVPSGTVLEVVQEGYTLGELVLRASRVIVAQ